MRKTIAVLGVALMVLTWSFPKVQAENWSLAKGQEWEFTITKQGALYQYVKHKVVGLKRRQGREVWEITGEIKSFGDKVKDIQMKELFRLDENYRMLRHEVNITGDDGIYINPITEWQGEQGYNHQLDTSMGIMQKKVYPYPEPVVIYDQTSLFMLEILLKSEKMVFDEPMAIYGDKIKSITMIAQPDSEFMTPDGLVQAAVFRIPELNQIVYFGSGWEVIGVEDQGKGLTVYRGDWVKKFK